jgi:hypothetical protein
MRKSWNPKALWSIQKQLHDEQSLEIISWNQECSTGISGYLNAEFRPA